MKRTFVVAASFAMLGMIGACQPPPGPTTTAPTIPVSPVIEPLAWLTGRWVGTHEGATIEETWSAPVGSSMIGAMRVIDEGKPAFYELLVLEDDAGTATMRLAHFKPGLRPTQTPTLSYRLAMATPTELAFDVVGADDVKRIRYVKTSNTELHVFLERNEGAEELKLMRAGH